MSMEETVEKLGGVIPVVDGNFTPLSQDKIKDLEENLQTEFPESYRNWLEKYGAAAFALFVKFQVAKDVSVMDQMNGDKIDTTYYLPFGVFYGDDGNVHSLNKNIAMYEGRMPETLIPFGNDGFGNQVCLGIEGDQKGKIYYWDHENEWDEDDYEDDYDEPMPPEMKFQNVYFVADSFDEFLKEMKVDEEM